MSNPGSGIACTSTTAATLVHPGSMAVSRDGRSVYVASARAVLTFHRDIATGALTQLPGTQGCVSETGEDFSGSGNFVCADGVAVGSPTSVAVSPDGRNVYVASGGLPEDADAVAVFDRDVDDGELTQKGGAAGCISDTGTGGACTDGKALNNAEAVAVSPDGRSVYVASSLHGAVAVFDRDLATGELTQKAGTDGCVSETGGVGTEVGCIDGVALDGAQSVAVSPDGLSVYVASSDVFFGGSDSVAVFDRDPATGELTQKAGTDGCISEDGTGGTCADGVALTAARSVTVSPDGANVYVAASSGVAIFDRDGTGALTQKTGTDGCVTEDGSSGACSDGIALADAFEVAVSSDARSVYVASEDSSAVAVFDRDPVTGALKQKAGTAACTSEDGTGGTCADGVALTAARSVTASPDGFSVYVGSTYFLDPAVAVFAREVPPPYDIDGDGESNALTDGLLLLRYFFGFRGAVLVTGAVDSDNCTRCTASEIEAYIKALLVL